MNPGSDISNESSIRFIRITGCFFLLAGILLSFNLWTSGRFFPTIPFTGVLSRVNYPFDIILLGLLSIALVSGILSGRQIIFILLFVLLIPIMLLDQMRWQPWVYLYAIILVPFLVKDEKRNHKDILSYFQLILIGVYIWSGIHKINSNFIDYTFTSLLSEVIVSKNLPMLQKWSSTGYIIPVIEIGTGIFLAIPKFRKMGVFFSLLTHIIILLILSPWGTNSNSIVYPWNLAMMCMVFLAFYYDKEQLISWKGYIGTSKFLFFLAILIVVILPTLNLFGRWDHYLSFSLYSGKPHEYFIAVEEGEVNKLGERFTPYFVDIEGMQGGVIINVNKWSMDELNVPFYPETRVFKQLSRTFCGLGIPNEKLYFIEFERPLTEMNFSSFQCKDL